MYKVYVKLINFTHIEAVFTKKGMNRDKLSYLNVAKPFWENCVQLLKNKLYTLNTELDKCPDSCSDVKEDYLHRIKETKEKLHDALECRTDLDICSYYCKFHNISYEKMEVET